MMNRPERVLTTAVRQHTRKISAGGLTAEGADGAVVPKGMSAETILAHPALGACVRTQARALLLTYQTCRRGAAPVASHQRGLMAQAVLARYFRNDANHPGAGVLAERCIELVAAYRVASRNTAAAFIREMLKYEVLRHVTDSDGQRHRPVEPSPMTHAVLQHWLGVHLATLDGLDGGARAAVLRAQPDML